MTPRMILEVRDAQGNVVWKAPEVKGAKAVDSRNAYLVTDILAGNTDRRQNPIWAEKLALSATQVRDLLARAREHGLLTPPVKKGMPGGALTDAAILLLKKGGTR